MSTTGAPTPRLGVEGRLSEDYIAEADIRVGLIARLTEAGLEGAALLTRVREVLDGLVPA